MEARENELSSIIEESESKKRNNNIYKKYRSWKRKNKNNIVFTSGFLFILLYYIY